ncbi:MAG: carboxymuconolactone decarboxylase family protein [Novosphingobium sp.]
MSTVEMVPAESWSPALQAAVKPDMMTPLEQGILRFLAHKPATALAFVGLQQAQESEATLNPRLRELVRLRIAFHNQCRSCMAIRYPDAVAAGLDDHLVCSLERPEEAPDLTAEERAALAFADKFATDHWSIERADYDALREHFEEAQLVELGLVCALCLGIGRLARTWDMTDELPAAFRQDAERIGPWQGEPVQVFKRRKFADQG